MYFHENVEGFITTWNTHKLHKKIIAPWNLTFPIPDEAHITSLQVTDNQFPTPNTCSLYTSGKLALNFNYNMKLSNCYTKIWRLQGNQRQLATLRTAYNHEQEKLCHTELQLIKLLSICKACVTLIADISTLSISSLPSDSITYTQLISTKTEFGLLWNYAFSLASLTAPSD